MATKVTNLDVIEEVTDLSPRAFNFETLALSSRYVLIIFNQDLFPTLIKTHFVPLLPDSSNLRHHFNLFPPFVPDFNTFESQFRKRTYFSIPGENKQVPARCPLILHPTPYSALSCFARSGFPTEIRTRLIPF